MEGERLGRYRLGRRIAVGGMAEVFSATVEGAAGFEKKVALKRILPHLAEDEEFVTMFREEALLVSRLNQANIAQVFDFAEENGVLFIAMEWVEGKDLRRVQKAMKKRGLKMSPARAAHIGREIARALAHAHALTDDDGRLQMLVHRDVSPQNILLSFGGEVKLTDFGIAKAAQRNSLTGTGIIKGKCAYMSPEQARGDPVDARSDLFSLGVVLWEQLAARKLFAGESDLAVLKAVQQFVAPPLSGIRGDVPADLGETVAKCLEKDADSRFQSAKALEDALHEVLLSHTSKASDTDLASLMEDLFPEEAAGRPRGTAKLPVPPADLPPPDRDPPTPLERKRPGAGTNEQGRRAGTADLAVPPREVGRRRGYVAGAALVALAGFGGWFLWPSPVTPPVSRGTEEPKHEVEPPEPGDSPSPAAQAVLEAEIPPVVDAPPEVEAFPPVSPPPAKAATAVAPSKARKPALAKRSRPPAKRRDRPPKAKSAPPEPSSPGVVTVFVKPWGELWVDGVKLGMTPLSEPLLLSPGEHIIEARHPDTGARDSRRVTVESGEMHTVRLNLAR